MMTSRFYKLIILCLTTLLFACDAHMQKGLEVYQPRYDDDVAWEANDADFFTEADDIDEAFPPGLEIEDIDPATQKEEASKNILSKITDIKYVVNPQNPSQFRIIFMGDGKIGRFNVKKKRDTVSLYLINVNNETHKRRFAGYANWVRYIKLKSRGNRTMIRIRFDSSVSMKLKMKKYKDSFHLLLKKR